MGMLVRETDEIRKLWVGTVLKIGTFEGQMVVDFAKRM